jgi:hypothetical protein
LIWGDLEFGQQQEGAGRRSHLSRLITQELTKIICITPLLNHNLVGVSGQLFGLTFGKCRQHAPVREQPGSAGRSRA